MFSRLIQKTDISHEEWCLADNNYATDIRALLLFYKLFARSSLYIIIYVVLLLWIFPYVFKIVVHQIITKIKINLKYAFPLKVHFPSC